MQNTLSEMRHLQVAYQAVESGRWEPNLESAPDEYRYSRTEINYSVHDESLASHAEKGVGGHAASHENSVLRCYIDLDDGTIHELK